jgi:hypothetical protein
MAEKVLQICPCPKEVRIAWYNAGRIDLHKPTCLAIVERGLTQEVVYLETVDNVIERVDTEDKNFLGFVEIDDSQEIARLTQQVQEQYQKEQSVKSK